MTTISTYKNKHNCKGFYSYYDFFSVQYFGWFTIHNLFSTLSEL